MNTENFREKILALLMAQNPESQQLGLALEQTTGTQLSGFWNNLRMVYGSIYPQHNQVNIPDKNYLLDWWRRSYQYGCPLWIEHIGYFDTTVSCFPLIKKVRLFQLYNKPCLEEHLTAQWLNGLGLFKSTRHVKLQFISQLPATFIHLLPHVQYCIIQQGTQLNALPEEIGAWTSLIQLEIHNCPLQQVPAQIGNCLQLQKWIIRGANLAFLPDSICRLKVLSFLECVYSGLEQLPEEIGAMSSLQVLLLTGNKLRGLPESILRLQHLRCINLESNPLDWATVGLLLLRMPGALKRICAIGGSSYPLERRYDEAGQPYFSITITHNFYKQTWSDYQERLPWAGVFEVLRQIPHLRQITIKCSRLQELPPEIGECKDLEVLNLANNLLETLPEALFTLPKLRVLLLRRNKLRTVPQGIRNMPSLRVLALRRNCLNTVPEWLGEMPYLMRLDIGENPIAALPLTMRIWSHNGRKRE